MEQIITAIDDEWQRHGPNTVRTKTEVLEPETMTATIGHLEISKGTTGIDITIDGKPIKGCYKATLVVAVDSVATLTTESYVLSTT